MASQVKPQAFLYNLELLAYHLREVNNVLTVVRCFCIPHWHSYCKIDLIDLQLKQQKRILITIMKMS